MTPVVIITIRLPSLWNLPSFVQVHQRLAMTRQPTPPPVTCIKETDSLLTELTAKGYALSRYVRATIDAERRKPRLVFKMLYEGYFRTPPKVQQLFMQHTAGRHELFIFQHTQVGVSLYLKPAGLQQ